MAHLGGRCRGHDHLRARLKFLHAAGVSDQESRQSYYCGNSVNSVIKRTYTPPAPSRFERSRQGMQPKTARAAPARASLTVNGPILRRSRSVGSTGRGARSPTCTAPVFEASIGKRALCSLWTCMEDLHESPGGVRERALVFANFDSKAAGSVRFLALSAPRTLYSDMLSTILGAAGARNRRATSNEKSTR
jgi:hypothetical protein